MLDSIGDLTALVTAVGVLVGAVGVAAVKISGCINELRQQTIKVQQQTVRMRMEAADTGEAVQNSAERIRQEILDISVKTELLYNRFGERVALNDNRFNRIEDRLHTIERERI